VNQKLENQRRAAIILANDLRTIAGEYSRFAFHPSGPKASARGLRDIAMALEGAQRETLRLADHFAKADGK
jgi:hypothetical protein